jgi:transcriptional regulator with XRE-family HTH domain
VVEKIGERLRLARAAADMTMREAAKASGVSKESITRIERGLQQPTHLTVARLARAYGQDPAEYLLEGQVPLGKGVAAEEGADPLAGWIGRALSEGDFARDFERAKGSQELADKLHRAKLAEATERQQVVATLQKHHAPPAEIQEARRDRLVSNAQLTAAAFLAVERWRGHDVAGMDPKGIVADVIRTQRKHLTGERDEGKPTSQAGESA